MTTEEREEIGTRGPADTWPGAFAWFGLGVAYAFGVVSILSIGVFILAIAVVATILLAGRASGRSGVPALISGLGVPLLYVAYLNRGGPGWVCTTTAHSQACADLGNPWTWLVCGAGLIVGGIVLMVGLNRGRARHGQ